ncbi:50S ribosomal protein L25 [Aeromonas simiae]|uniref:Large ribosomal subunit protein bL25 n=1 Tax=Aeromonas simiae TaxID=218936 RepID=A0A5J6WWV7_9GAMM|nr:50S ribosomal protein L25 [Aeromonas simiae]QFI54647.1 50S ribosomal protein L25 [Aeromonas simiae]
MSFVFQAEVRTDMGKGASRRLRHADLVPAIVYGADKEAVSLTLDHKKLIIAQENPAFYSDVLTLVVNGEEMKVKVKDIQRHPVKPKLVHLDFVRA